MSTVAERIEQRLEALGKTASGVAIEAGLGRSSVRDILNGKAENPRLDTLKKLTGPLQCSLAFLTGQTDIPDRPEVKVKNWQDIRVDVEPVEDVIEAGAFRERPSSWGVSVTGKIEDDVTHYVNWQDLRLPLHGMFSYELADDTMAGIGIRKGDVIGAAHHTFEGEIELTQGRLVVVRHRFNVPGIEEVSLRQVEVEEGIVSLVSHPLTGTVRPIVLRPPTAEERGGNRSPNLWISDTGGEVRIEAIAVRLVRTFPI